MISRLLKKMEQRKLVQLHREYDRIAGPSGRVVMPVTNRALLPHQSCTNAMQIFGYIASVLIGISLGLVGSGGSIPDSTGAGLPDGH